MALLRRQVGRPYAISLAPWHLSLIYGALAFNATNDEECVSLEVNPAGTYGFIEEATGLALTHAIAQTLICGTPNTPR